MLTLLSHIKCGTHEKHFLLKFLLRYEHVSKPLHSRQQLAAILGIPLTRCYQSLRSLSSSGHLEAHKRRGDLTTVFAVSELDSLQSRWLEQLNAHPHHPQIVQLLNTHPVPVDSRQHQLTIPQRLLLISLLEEASEFGLVTGLSLGSMATRTGIERRRIQALLRDLWGYGYIRHLVAESQGMSDSEILAGIYLLAPQHKSYRLNRAAPLTLIFGNVEANLVREQVRFVYALKERYRFDRSYMTARKGQPDTGSDGHSESSTAAPSDHNWRHLNWCYLNIVSRLINEYWELIEADDRSEALRNLRVWVNQLNLEVFAAGLAINNLDAYVNDLKGAVADAALTLAIALKKALTSEVVAWRFQGRPLVNLLPSGLINTHEVLPIEILLSTYQAADGPRQTGTIPYIDKNDVGELKEYQLTNPQLLKRARLEEGREGKPRLRDFQRGYPNQAK